MSSWLSLAISGPGIPNGQILDVTGADIRAWETATQQSWFEAAVITATQSMELAQIVARRLGLWPELTDDEARWWGEVVALPGRANENLDPTPPAPTAS